VRVVLYFRIKEIRWGVPDEILAQLRARFPAVEFEAVDDDARLAPALGDAEAFFGFNFPRDLFAAAPRLRWVHSASAGIEANLFPALVASDVVLTNATGMHTDGIPEHCLALMLALARNLHLAERHRALRRWDRLGMITAGAGIRTLAGSRLAVLGAGAIGRGIAKRAAALGMTVRVQRRRPGTPVEGAEAVVGPDDLPPLLAWADFVVIALPFTPETRHLIGKTALDAMRSTAFLVNVGRGEIVDDAALVDALRTGAIAGAGLDVFSEEPLPESSPYWTLDNVVLTPHVSGYLPDFFARAVAIFADNLERHLAGRPLRNVVDKRLGYAPLGA
jgi:phosphoglycerate dehydrogenase-like enzyme